MERRMICITCPMGCELSVEREGEDEVRVSGNRCARGAAYAREEILAPKRVVTATVRLASETAGLRRAPWRTSAAFPRERTGELLAAMYAMEVAPPVRTGAVLLPNALGTGIDVVATRTVE